MAVIKIACSKCGQRVSGDESFYGTTVECPVCSAIIAFPEPEISNQPAPANNPAPADIASTPPAATDAGPGMPTLGARGEDIPSMQTTSIPLLPENIVPQDSKRMSTLNAAMETAPAADPPSSLLSVLSMVFGILGLVFFFVGASLLCAPVAIILGHVALAKAKHSEIQPAPGSTMALIGTILGYAGLFVILLLLTTYSIWSRFVPQLSGE